MSEEQQRMEFRVGSEDIPSCPKCGSTQVRENGFVIGIDHFGNSKWKADVDEISRDLGNHAMCNEEDCEWEGTCGDLYRHPIDHQLSVKEMHTIEYTIKATSRQAAKEKLENRDQWGKDIYDHGGTWDTREPTEEPALDLEFPEPEQLKRYFERIVHQTNILAKIHENPGWKDGDAVNVLRSMHMLLMDSIEEINNLTKDKEEIAKTMGEVEIQLERFMAPWLAGYSTPNVIHNMAKTIIGYGRRIGKMEEEIHSTGQQATEEIDKLTEERKEIFKTVNETADRLGNLATWAAGESIPNVIRKMARSIEHTMEMLKEEKKWQEGRFASTQKSRS